MYNFMHVILFSKFQYQRPYPYSCWTYDLSLHIQNIQNYQNYEISPTQDLKQEQDQSQFVEKQQELLIEQPKKTIQQVNKEEKLRKILNVTEQQFRTLKTTFKKFHWSSDDDKNSWNWFSSNTLGFKFLVFSFIDFQNMIDNCNLIKLMNILKQYPNFHNISQSIITKQGIHKKVGLNRRKKWLKIQQFTKQGLNGNISEQIKTKIPKRIREHCMNCLRLNKKNRFCQKLNMRK